MLISQSIPRPAAGISVAKWNHEMGGTWTITGSDPVQEREVDGRTYWFLLLEGMEPGTGPYISATELWGLQPSLGDDTSQWAGQQVVVDVKEYVIDGVTRKGFVYEAV